MPRLYLESINEGLARLHVFSIVVVHDIELPSRVSGWISRVAPSNGHTIPNRNLTGLQCLTISSTTLYQCGQVKQQVAIFVMNNMFSFGALLRFSSSLNYACNACRKSIIVGVYLPCQISIVRKRSFLRSLCLGMIMTCTQRRQADSASRLI
jgi:hypothetical protein